MSLARVNGSDGLFGMITSLINDRLRQDRVHGHTIYTEEKVVELLGLNTLKKDNLVALAKVLGEECDIFKHTDKEEYSSKLLDFDYECSGALQKLIGAGYVRIEWWHCGGDKKKKKIDKLDTSQVSLNGFKRLVEEATGNGSSNTTSRRLSSSYVPPQQRSAVKVFVTFDIDKLAKENLTMFPEINLMTFVCNRVYSGLSLVSETKTLPVKPTRKRDGSNSSSDVWCQLRYNFYANAMNEDSIAFAVNEMGIDESCLNKSTRVKVLFALRDAVDTNNEWASCPLLHVGTNFKTGEISQSFYDNITSSSTNKDNITALKDEDGDREKDVCGVYSQKNPTLEIPAKLQEAEVVVRYSLKEASELYIAKQRVSDSLTVNLAFCHPKARMRHLFMAYVTCVFAKSVSDYDRTYVDKRSNEIFLGKNAVLTSPVEPAAASGGYKVSRKISLASDVCYACDSERCRSCGRLVHDNELPCDKKEYRNIIVKKLKAKVLIDNGKTEQYTMKPCDRASVVHSYFCKKVRVKAPIMTGKEEEEHPYYDFKVNKRTKLVLYGKVKDVVTTKPSLSSFSYEPIFEERGSWRDKRDHHIKNVASSSEPLRKRIFYNKEDDLIDEDIVDKLSDSSFRDIMVREVDVEQAEHHFARSGYPEEIYDELETLFKKLEASPRDSAREAKIFVDFVCRIAPEGKIEAGVYDDKTNVAGAVRFVFGLLRGVNQRNQATLFTMMNKSMVTESTLVMIGARCAVSDIVAGKTMVVRQFVAASKDMEMAPVSESDLANYTVMKGSVSATTAPNDKLSFGACQTWKSRGVEDPPIPDAASHPEVRGVRCVSTTPGGSYSSFNTSTKRSLPALKRSPPSAGKYIPPHLR